MLTAVRSFTVWIPVVSGLASCGGDGETCLHTIITYTGPKGGAAYARITSDDGGRSFFSASNALSIQDMIAVESGTVLCTSGGSPVDLPITAIVWIDPSGTESTACADLTNNPNCHPASTDPQGRQSAVMRFGQVTVIRVNVVDFP